MPCRRTIFAGLLSVYLGLLFSPGLSIADSDSAPEVHYVWALEVNDYGDPIFGAVRQLILRDHKKRIIYWALPQGKASIYFSGEGGCILWKFPSGGTTTSDRPRVVSFERYFYTRTLLDVERYEFAAGGAKPWPGLRMQKWDATTPSPIDWRDVDLMNTPPEPVE